MRFLSQSYYGVRAVSFLAKNKGCFSVREISQKENIPYDYLEKIMQRLVKKGLVEAKRGFSGGYLLKKPAAKITIQEIFNALGEEILPLVCLSERGKVGFCPFEKSCLSKNLWRKIKKVIIKTLTSTTLADLIYAGNKKS